MIRQILTYKDDPRAEKVNLTLVDYDIPHKLRKCLIEINVLVCPFRFI